LASPYPELAPERDAWILAQRPARNALDPRQPHAFLIEEERAESGEIVRVATVFLTNRGCPWRCVMCDLWRNTLPDANPPGAIPEQIDYALDRLGPARQIKLYNSGSFFDRGAIPETDHAAIAQRLRPFERVVVECHPALIGESCARFSKMLAAPEDSGKGAGPALEVAMGLETAHPEVLARLNKRMTLEGFASAADFLRRNNIALRVFILVKPPFLDEKDALVWVKRSIDFAFDCDAAVVSLIPTRFGNGALEALAESGQFSPPKLRTLEEATAYGVGLGRGRVFADLWDLEKFSDCPACFAARRARLHEMNLSQTITPFIHCEECV